MRDKEELKDHIQERIKLGQQLLNLEITSEPQMKIAWREFHSWNKVSYEIIASVEIPSGEINRFRMRLITIGIGI